MEYIEAIVGGVSAIVGVVGKSLWDKYGQHRKIHELIDDTLNRTASMAGRIIELEQEVMELKKKLINLQSKNQDQT